MWPVPAQPAVEEGTDASVDGLAKDFESVVYDETGVCTCGRKGFEITAPDCLGHGGATFQER